MKQQLLHKLRSGLLAVVVAAGFAAVSVAPANAASVTKINAGSVDTFGEWKADYAYSGGISDWSRDWQPVDTSLVTSPGPEDVYNTERYGNFTYAVRNLTANKSYSVRLHFSEFYWTNAGQRVFNVLSNGTTILSNFDIIREAGSANKAIAKSFTLNANSNGVINLKFVTVVDAAKVSGIEVFTIDTPATPPSAPTTLTGSATSSSVSLNWGASTAGTNPISSYSVERGGVAIATVSATTRSYTDSTVSPSTAYTYRVRAKDSTGVWSSYSPVYNVTTPAGQTAPVTLYNASKKEIAMQLVSSAENSSLDWKAQYRYIEDIGDGRGYTAGIIGFCSGTGDMLEVVNYYTQLNPTNGLKQYLPALQNVNGTSSHTGLDPGFVTAWRNAADNDPLFRQAQDYLRDEWYFKPAVDQAIADGLGVLGQFIYYDAIVMHGPGTDPTSFGGIRSAAIARATRPSQGGDQTTYLNAFLDERKRVMLLEAAHTDTDRVDTEQRKFLNEGNLNLNVPLYWSVYGDPYQITVAP